MTRQIIFVVAALQTALAAALCFIPLFDLLGYEFSFAVGLLAAPSSLVIGYSVGCAQGKHSTDWLRAGLLATLVLLPALAMITLNMLRVRNCDYLEGLLFFLAFPVVSSIYGSTLGVTISRLGARGVLGFGVVAFVAALPLALRLRELYVQPQIFVFDHLWGYFAGALYDETIELDFRTLGFRLGTALIVAITIALVEATTRSRIPQIATILLVLAAHLVVDETLGQAMVYRLDRQDIEKELNVVVKRPGLTVYLPQNTGAKRAEIIADYHMFWIEKLSHELGIEPPRPLKSYVYRDATQKALLMGGANTMVAKPWLGEIHVHGLETPHQVIPHELTHVIAAPLGRWPFAVTARHGVLIDLGIVEGLAEALTPPRGDYELHRWVRALRLMDLAPDVRRLLRVTDFWRASPRRAYTVMGSFIRYLLDTRGPEPIRKLYADGDFDGALGEDLDHVVTEWERFIDAQQLNNTERQAAEERFRRGSIFSRTCAHEVASLRDSARQASPEEAVEYHRRIASFLDGDVNARYELSMAELAAGHQERFLNGAQGLLQQPSLNAQRRVLLHERMGDIEWQRGDLDAARDHFSRALDTPSSAASARLQWVRLWALERDADERRTLQQLLGGELSALAAVLELDRLAEKHPSDPTLPYLLARQLLAAGERDRAMNRLSRNGTHPFQAIEAERLRLMAEILEDQRDYRAAADMLDAASRHLARSGIKAQFRAESEWLRWRARHENRRTSNHDSAPH